MQKLGKTSFNFKKVKIIKEKAIITFCLLIISIISSAKVIYVKNIDSNAWSGRELVYNNLQKAIDEASDYDSIWVASGTYYPTTSYNGSSDNLFYSITIKKSISIFGGFIGNENSLDDRQLEDKNKDNNIAPYEFSNETIFSSDFNNDDKWSEETNSNYHWKYGNIGENSFHVIYINDKNQISPKIEINGITIQGGTGSIVHNGTGKGGGINGNISSKSKFLVQNCIFSKNLAEFNGGAINVDISSTDSCQIQIENNSFLKNSTVGGILCLYSSYKALKPVINIKHNVISNNDGSGIQLLCSSNLNINIESNTLFNNLSSSTGGIYVNINNANTQTDLDINNNTFHSNIGGDGGAIKMKFFSGDFNIKTNNNSFIKNSAKTRGGAISIECTKDCYGNILFENDIIQSNQTKGSNGGGFYIDVPRNIVTIIRSCIISNNYSASTIYGGAIAFKTGYLNCINNLINNNSSGVYIFSVYGGGKFVNNTIANDGNTGIIISNDQTNLSIYNNLIVNNKQELNLGVPSMMSNNITGNLDCFKNPPSFIGYTDGIYDYQAFDFNLISNTQAINKGLSSASFNMLLPSTDLEGNPRIIGDTIDIGAYEFQISTYSGSIEDNSNISIFPNPCRQILHLKNINPSTDIAIYNSCGTMVGSFTCETNYMTLDLSYLKEGVYFLRIRDGKASYQTKILKI
jgi:predicted outer membrane repeat protein